MRKYLLFYVLFLITISSAIPFTSNVRNVGVNIVGGNETKPHEYPFIVDVMRTIGTPSSHYCAGAILSEEWIITTVNCAYSPEKEIVAGDHNNKQVEGTEQRRKVVQRILHPDFGVSDGANDIAVMKISPPLEFNSFVQPADLAQEGYVVSGEVIVAGWGALSGWDGGRPATLHHVVVSFVDDGACQKAFAGEPVEILDTHICAGHPDGGRGICHDDSGDPLIHNGKLVGLASFGYGCEDGLYPDVYTEISKYTEWIENAIRTN